MLLLVAGGKGWLCFWFFLLTLKLRGRRRWYTVVSSSCVGTTQTNKYVNFPPLRVFVADDRLLDGADPNVKIFVAFSSSIYCSKLCSIRSVEQTKDSIDCLVGPVGELTCLFFHSIYQLFTAR